MKSPAYVPQVRLFQDWLQAHRQLSFPDYESLWQWSVDDLPAFWQAIWDYFDLQSPTPHRSVLSDATMPGTRWFEGAQANYARQVFRHVGAADALGLPAVISRNEKGAARELSWPQLQRQ